MKKDYILEFKRKRKGKTNYKKRLKLLLASRPRLVVRKSLKNILVQIVEYGGKGDKVIVSVHSCELKKYGWEKSRCNLPSSYLVGMLIGDKAKKKGLKEAVLDIGLQNSIKGSRIYALLKGCIDSGLDVPHSKNVLPKEDRVNGKHIKDFDVNKFEEVKSKIVGVKNA